MNTSIRPPRLRGAIGTVAVLAMAITGATAVPAYAAPRGGVHAVAQPVTPAAAPGQQSVARGCYSGGVIVLTNNSVMEAESYGNPASIDDYTNNGGTNQQWALCKLSNGYDEIVSDYNGSMMCLNVSNGSYTSGTDLLAWPCNTVVGSNEQWRQPGNTPDSHISGYDYLVPAGNYNLCANVSGGIGSGHKLILYACNAGTNEAFKVTSSASVKDRLGIVTYAASYLGYTDDPAGTFCNEFSKYWGDGSSADCAGTGNYDTEWCADFAAYTWRFGGSVSFNYQYTSGYLNGGAASFYLYGQSKGTWHSASSGYNPKPGDVAVYGLNSTGTYAAHVAVVIGKTSGNSGPNVINGDYVYDTEYQADQATIPGGDALDGYTSPPGL